MIWGGRKEGHLVFQGASNSTVRAVFLQLFECFPSLRDSHQNIISKRRDIS